MSSTTDALTPVSQRASRTSAAVVGAYRSIYIVKRYSGTCQIAGEYVVRDFAGGWGVVNQV